MKKIIIVAMAVALPGEKGPERFYYISQMLTKQGYDVELITGTFQHWEKRQRNKDEIRGDIKVTLVNQSAYPKTVCVERIVSLWKLANSILDTLQDKYFDAIYCSIPDNRTAALISNYAKKKHKKVIIDIEDLWPEGMKMALKKHKYGAVLSHFLFMYSFYARKAYKNADGYIGTSCEYTYIPDVYQKKNKEKLHSTVYVGTDLSTFDKYVMNNQFVVKKENEEKWIIYAGTIGVTYDIRTLIDCAKIIEKIDKSIKFLILGDGPLKNELQEYTNSTCRNVSFLGYMKYENMVVYLQQADLLINSFAKGAPQSIVTKIGDYLAAGKPIINTLESNEFMNIIEKEDVGYNVEPENAEELKNCILNAIADLNGMIQKGANARKLAEKDFDRKSAYLKIDKMLIDLLN